MKPFPKWLTIFAVLGGSAGSIYAAIQTKDWMALAGLIGSILAGFGHSVTGTGGSPQNP